MVRQFFVRQVPHTANIGLLQAGRTVVNQSVAHLIKFSACGQVSASNAPPDNKPKNVIANLKTADKQHA